LKWTKIKSIILWFLLVMNVFMLIIIGITIGKQNEIPKEVVDSSISLLTKDGFEIDRKIFPDNYYNLPSYSATFYSAGDLSTIFFDQEVAFRTFENSLVATKDGATLTVTGNHFTYENDNKPKEDGSSAIKKALTKAGIDMEGAVYDKKNNCFYRMYNDVNLFNMSIQAKIDKNGNLCYVNAYWPKDLAQGERKKFSFLENVVRLKEVFPEKGKISNIELGYELQSLGGEQYAFVPAWRVTVNDLTKIIQ